LEGDVRRILLAWRRGGFNATAAAIINRVSDGLWDVRLGTRTAGLISIETLIADWRGCHDYFPTSYRELRRVLDDLSPGSSDVFLDIGAGKGRALIVAAAYPFRRVTGVEISTDLCRVARANIERRRRHFRCQDVRLVEADGSVIAIADDVTIIYLYNPFRAERLQRLFCNIETSVIAAPRDVTVIYNNPARFIEFEKEFSWLHRVATYEGEYQWVVYRAHAPSGGNP
jgi:SAM-dependent methyltransferase